MRLSISPPLACLEVKIAVTLQKLSMCQHLFIKAKLRAKFTNNAFSEAASLFSKVG